MRRTVAALVVSLVSLMPVAPPAGALGATRPTIALVTSSKVPQFESATHALSDTLRRNPAQPELLTFDLEGDRANAPAVLDRVRSAHPQLIVTIGSLATAVVLDDPSPVPVVFTMVLYPAQSGFTSRPGREVTGVSLDLPLDVQFDYLRRLVPKAQRIGVLFHEDETGRVIAAARAAAPTHGLTLVEEQVDDPGAAVPALERLMRTVDLVWTVADGHVFTPQTTPALILAALRSQVPLIGISAAHVRTGALAALYCDYEDVGAQTAELIARVLAGEAPHAIPVASPRRIALALNRRTADHLNLTIAPALEREAGMTVP